MSTHAGKMMGESGGQEALWYREEIFQALIETSPYGVLLLDQQGFIQYASPAAQDLLGYTSEEIAGRNAFELIYADDQERTLTVLAELLGEPGKSLRAKFRACHKDGILRWMEGVGTNLLHDPRVGGIVASYWDITERVKAEELHFQLAALVESSDDAILGKNLDGIITSWNTGAERMYGYSAQEIVGRPVTLLFAPDRMDEFAQIMERISRGERLEQYETVRVRKDGTLLQVSVTVSPIKDRAGNIIGASTIARDITERKRMEQRQRILDQVSDLVVSSLDQQIALSEIAQLIVPSMADYCRIAVLDERQQIQETTVNHVDPRKVALARELYEHYKDRSGVVYGVQRLLQTGKPELISDVFRDVLAQGRVPADLREIMEKLDLKSYMGVPLVARGRTIGAMTFSSTQPYRWYTDTDLRFAQELARRIALALDNAHLYAQAQAEIRERKRVEEALRENEARKDEFIGMASHELRTPVTSLKGFTHLLHRRLDQQGDEHGLNYVARMDRQLDKLTKLISDLLDISRMQTGHLVFRVEPFDLDALIEEVVENVRGTTSTHRLSIEGAAASQVIGDRDRIGQVLVNLLTNAIKYSPQGRSVIVRVTRDAEQVIVSVQDFGIGIAEVHHSRIFERFYQVSEPGEKPYSGLGIGLYISSEIIKRHSGRIWVESRKGEGSTFSFSLPLCKGD